MAEGKITAFPHWICTAHFLGESVSIIAEQALGVLQTWFTPELHHMSW